jgi:hypothetical protein
MWKKIGVAALIMGVMAIDQTFAGFVSITPPPPAPIPEIDGAAGLAAMALLGSFGALLFSRSRNKA